ncbi:hypothetical protein GOODEAATRI_000445 [Goodea atripinnis]|uniref:Uncharacterized protein n=1 Tax=Goodea atripinnis TaxID=208336 RepID=A0ABV0MN86_9TELE
MGLDAFDEPLPAEQPGVPESLAPRFGVKDPPTAPPKPRPDILRPRFGKPKLPESTNKDSVPKANIDVFPSYSDFRSSVLERRDREVEKEKEMESEKASDREGVEDLDVKETPDLFLTRHESFRSRINPLLQRSSRLRSSLIFTSSKAEIHKILQPHKTQNETDNQKKDEPKILKPPPSPKISWKDQLKPRSLNSRRISSGEDILTKDATDAEKSEMKKSRSHSSSTLPHEESKEGLHKVMGSNTSLNTIGEGKSDGKTLEFLKKQTQRLKGLLGPKDKEKKTSGDDRGMSTVMEVADDLSKKQGTLAKVIMSTATEQPATNLKESTGKSASSRYQAPGSSALYSSNLRDDTKVILEQISANSQKNRQEREETGGAKDSGTTDKGQETQNPLKKNRFLRPVGNTQEREGLLKRIESLRKEKKVYSRFEVVYVTIDGKKI